MNIAAAPEVGIGSGIERLQCWVGWELVLLFLLLFMAAATRAATLCSHHYVVVSCRAFTHRTAFPHCTQIRKYFPRRAHVTKCQEFRASSSDRALVVIRLLPAKNARVMLCFRPSCVNDPSSRLTFSALTLEKFLPLLDECIFKAAFSQPSCSSRVRVDAE